MYAGDGNDDVQVAGGVTLETWLYGGKGNTVLVGETWYWDNSNDVWVKLEGIGSPSARTQHRMAYDATREQIQPGETENSGKKNREQRTVHVGSMPSFVKR